MQDSAAGRRRSVALDVLRMAAVLLVLGRHMQTWPLELGKGFTFYATRLWQNGGWTGVDLFFVLSGFLIGGLLFDEARRTGAIRIGRFLIRRGLKIYPPFYVLLAATLIWFPMQGIVIPLRWKLGELFFLQNYLGGIWNHTWSLAVEEHFYLALPLLLALLLRIRRGTDDPFRVVPLIAVAAAFVCLALRVALALTIPFENMVHLFPTHLRIDSLLVGVAIAYADHYHPAVLASLRGRFRMPLLVIGPLFFVPAFRYPLGGRWWLYSLCVTGFAIGSAALLIAVADLAWRNRFARFTSYLGARSYSIYLCHAPVAMLAEEWWRTRGASGGGAWWYAYFAVYITTSIVVGLLFAAAIELPVNRLRERIAPTSASPLVIPAP